MAMAGGCWNASLPWSSSLALTCRRCPSWLRRIWWSWPKLLVIFRGESWENHGKYLNIWDNWGFQLAVTSQNLWKVPDFQTSRDPNYLVGQLYGSKWLFGNGCFQDLSWSNVAQDASLQRLQMLVPLKMLTMSCQGYLSFFWQKGWMFEFFHVFSLSASVVFVWVRVRCGSLWWTKECGKSLGLDTLRMESFCLSNKLPTTSWHFPPPKKEEQVWRPLSQEIAMKRPLPSPFPVIFRKLPLRCARSAPDTVRAVPVSRASACFWSQMMWKHASPRWGDGCGWMWFFAILVCFFGIYWVYHRLPFDREQLVIQQWIFRGFP